MRRDLPTTFRVTGNKGCNLTEALLIGSHAVDIRNSLQSHYFPALTSLTYQGEPVQPPVPLPWYPDSLAWQITVKKEVIRKDPSFRKFQNFLVCECEVGNISRQEAVSMIPPLLLDVKPHHRVIDLCAAPGSKTAQILEALNVLDIDPEGVPKWPTGLVVANDNDYKRCYLMIHQLNRIPSSTYMATSYDASQFPNLRGPGPDGQDEIIKFDRVLADVPCSGDGTMRKNPAIWKTWGIKNGAGLHPLQTRILYRGLQMLAVGGRLVYSTCSLNPLENEAVVAEALRMTGDAIEVIDVSKELEGLIRQPGMQTWKIFDANGEEMEREDLEEGGKFTTTMFPPTDDETGIKEQLARGMRIYPHLQDTGGFFIIVMEKKAPLGKKVDLPTSTEDAPIETNGHDSIPLKRSPDDPAPAPAPKKQKLDAPQTNRNSRDQKSAPNPSSEDPFSFIPPSHPELVLIRDFFNLSPHFPLTDLFVRNSTGELLRAIYIASPLVQAIIQRNPNLRLFNAGTRLFVRQPDPKGDAKCFWRIHSDGLSLVDRFLGPERVIEADIDEIKDIIQESAQFPLIRDLGKRLRTSISGMGNGGFVLRVDPSASQATDMNVPFSLPMWKSPCAIKYVSLLR
jgi:multisite-specific tRNA:(cytosine-C5)-methyltransferase